MGKTCKDLEQALNEATAKGYAPEAVKLILGGKKTNVGRFSPISAVIDGLILRLERKEELKGPLFESRVKPE